MAKELEKLFDSKARPKVLNLFFQNPEAAFKSKEVAKKSQIDSRVARKEMEKMRKIKLLLRKKQKKQFFYSLNPKFPFLEELKSLVMSTAPISFREVKKIFARVPRIKLLFVSGSFVEEKRSPVDVLIVGDNISRSKISKAIKNIESYTGRDLRWTSMNLKEFNYRFHINDRFLNDILSHKNKIIINKIKWTGVC
jgi:hypothetical protein